MKMSKLDLFLFFFLLIIKNGFLYPRRTNIWNNQQTYLSSWGLLDAGSTWIDGKAHPHDTVGGPLQQQIFFMELLFD